jgi:hypothetical protein
MEPILSWVFTSLGYSPFPLRLRRFAQPPLSHFLATNAETGVATVPQSLDTREDRLASREAADPSEVSVLVIGSHRRSKRESMCRTR